MNPNECMLLCFGGPLDGAVLVPGAAIPNGYLETGGVLVVWEWLDWAKLPMWSRDER